MPGYAVGVDLGTTYTAAAVLRDGRVDVVELGDRVASVASVLWFRDDHGVVVGEAAVRRAEAEPGRVAREFKRRFGDPVPIMVAGTPMSADALTARLLRWVVDTVTEQEGGPPLSVGVTHPANWGPYKLDLLAQAVRLAGVHQAQLVSEPVAAAESHASAARVAVDDVVAVYDLGGGTFDGAVLRRGESRFDLLGRAEGIERLGGIDFDEAVFDHVRQALGPELAKLNLGDPVVGQALSRLREECAEAKEALSADTEVSIPVALPGLHTTVRLTRGEFEEMIRPSVTATIEMLSRVIASAGLAEGELTKVLLIGGSSRIPLVSLMVNAELGVPVALDTYPKHAVAMGAAYLTGTDVPGADAAQAPPAGGLATAGGAAAAGVAATAHTADAGPPTLPETTVPEGRGGPPSHPPPPIAGLGDSPPPGPLPGRRPSWGKRVVLVVVLVVAAVLLTPRLLDLARDGGLLPFDTAAGEVFLEPAAQTGPDPFTAPVANPDNPTVEAAGTGGATPDASGPNATRGVRGDAVGLFGGTNRSRICDKDQLAAFLVADNAKGAAWAGTLGVQPDRVGRYVEGLTPVLLQADTRVTNHGYRGGEVTARQAVLQTGTAVLVDEMGQPRVRCACGNPLTEAVAVPGPLRYPGPGWAKFDPARLTVVVPAEQPVDSFVLRDVETGQASSRPAGTDGDADVASEQDLPPYPQAAPQGSDPQQSRPAGQDPASQAPGSQDPASQNPASQEPASQDPASQDPAGQDPASQDPASQDPASQDPAGQDPGGQDTPGTGSDGTSDGGAGDGTSDGESGGTPNGG